MRRLAPWVKKDIRSNYGDLPSFEDFENNFNAEQGEGGTYHIRAGMGGEPGLGLDEYEERNYTAKELYRALKKSVTMWNHGYTRGRNGTPKGENAIELASSILDTLGIEWI